MTATLIGVPTSPPSGPGGPNVAAWQDTAGNDHQALVIESLDSSGNTQAASSTNPLPCNIVAGSAAAGIAGTPSADVLSVQGITGMIPVQTVSALTLVNGASYSNGMAPATPAVVTAKASTGNVRQIFAVNTNATPTWLKFWDTSVAPVLGTTAATWQVPIPGNSGGAGIVIPMVVPRTHLNAIYYAVTGAPGATDNTSITANTTFVDVSFN